MKKMHAALIDNAIFNLKNGISEIDSEPRKAVINFCNGVELLFKSFIFEEHWSLIAEKPGQITIDNFKIGNFKSISFDSCLDILRNISSITFTKEELSSIKNIQKHRNCLVHFVDMRYSKKDQRELISMFLELLTCWIALWKVIDNSKSKAFKKYNAHFQELNKEIHKKKNVLNAKYDDMKKKRLLSPESRKCFRCEFKAVAVHKEYQNLIQNKCLVCDTSDWSIAVECSNCNERIVLLENISVNCKKCKSDIIPEVEIESLNDYSEKAYCCNCGDQSVINVDQRWFCYNCFEIHSDVERCDYCNELNTGDMEFSYINGCAVCDGKDFND